MSGFIIFVAVVIVVSLINKARQQSNRTNGKVNPRVQALVEKIQAQQAGLQPSQFQGQYTQAAGQAGPPPNQARTFPAQTGNPAPYQPPAQFQPAQYQSAQFQPAQYPPVQFQPAPYAPNPYQPPAHRPPQSQLPVSNQDLDAQVRTLMNANNEVGAIRLLGEQRELGILEAQQYARALVAPTTTPRSADQDQPDEPDENDGRYVGSAAFAESIFNLDDREENVWASGWVDEPEPEDRSDIDELWQTVRNAPRPGPTP
jgi:hypothetical protein